MTILTPDVAEALFGPTSSAIRNPWFFGIVDQGIGAVGMLLNLAVTLGLTPFFGRPPEEIRLMVDSVREPEGFGLALEIEAAVEH